MATQKHPLTMEYALLGFLRQRPMHGYEIHQRIEAGEDDGMVWRVKQSLLYTMLGRLEDEGLVSSTLETHGARPPRKRYSLTAKGDTLLQAWLQTPVRNGRDFRLEFLTKLYFAQLAGSSAALTLIRRQLTASQTQLNRLTHTANTAATTESFAGLVSDFRVGQMEAVINWLKTCEQLYTVKEARESRGA
ncbi:MAG: helix-turn-helix transcriptional regulator [Anaerolineales bacterium]|nr:helix-turn-helix transcriptional regulator [Anaerolineales bacterium]